MELNELLAISATIIAALGGGGAIVLGMSNWIGRILAGRYVERLKHEVQQDLESYKTKLRKSEFLFEKEFEAASQFIALRRRIIPRYRHPDMDRHEACEDFAQSLHSVERKLTEYMEVHGAALQQSALQLLTEAIEHSSIGKFEARGEDVTPEGIELAETIMKELEELEDRLREVVWKQSSTG